MPKARDRYHLRSLGTVSCALVLLSSASVICDKTVSRGGFRLEAAALSERPAAAQTASAAPRKDAASQPGDVQPNPATNCLVSLDVWASTPFFASDYRVGSVLEVAIELDRSACDCAELRLEWLEWTSYVEDSMLHLGIEPFRWQDHRLLNPTAGGMWRDWDRVVAREESDKRRVRITDEPAVTRRKWVNGEWVGFDRDRLLLIEIRVSCVDTAGAQPHRQLSYCIVQRIEVRDGEYVGGLLHVAPGPLDWSRWTAPYESPGAPATIVALRQ